MKVGDLVTWPEGHCDIPGLILEARPAKGSRSRWSPSVSINPHGLAVLAMLPELGNDPEWFHECELEVINESR